MKNALLWSLLLLLFAGVGSLSPSTAEKNIQRKVDGERVFKQHCASCHAGGGNNIKPKRTVAGSRELATLATFKAYLSHPPGHMPYYQNVVGNHQVLEALYKYCKRLPKQRMKQVLGPDRTSTVCLDGLH